MRVLVTGATGFIGKALVARLLADGHAIIAVSRDPARAKATLGGAVEAISLDALAGVVRGVDGVINLAGEPVFPHRWTDARKASIVDSRVGLTRRVVEAMGPAGGGPKVLVSASAIGYYGDRDEADLDESSGPGRDFLAELCIAWEREALKAEARGTRVAVIRVGIVLGMGGGALEQMLPPFRMGLGGVVGSGHQYVSWIHLDDMVEILRAALADERYRGPINGTAPDPVTQSELSYSLGSALGRPVLVPVPAFAVRLALGEAATAVLGGQRVLPRRLQQLDFRFQHPELPNALAEILG